MLRRSIVEGKFLEWKQKNQGKTALLIEGARRVGKSVAARQFAKKYYKTHIVIDFNEVGDDIKRLFENSLTDLDNLFKYLSAAYNVKLYERESVIIFDEVQLFPRARAAIKFLVADGRYDYIETGSLMSIKANVQNIVIPSEERHIKMYPMTFEEFLWAKGEDLIMPIITEAMQCKKPLGQALHRKIMTLFREYIIVGGMPQAVAEYVETGDFEAVDLIKRDILDLYRADIRKYAKGYGTKVESILDDIPSQLSKKEKRFTLSTLREGARYRNYENAFFWLQDSRIANVCFNSSEPNIGLKLNRDSTAFKMYFGDTGLLISWAFDESGIVSQEIYKKILFGKLEVNEGMIFENIVAQMLTARDKNLFYYSNASRTDKLSRMEIDFLLAKSKITSRHNITPIEVKSGKRYTLSSLKKFKAKFKEQVDTAYIVHTEDFKEVDGFVYLPVYMVPCL